MRSVVIYLVLSPVCMPMPCSDSPLKSHKRKMWCKRSLFNAYLRKYQVIQTICAQCSKSEYIYHSYINHRCGSAWKEFLKLSNLKEENPKRQHWMRYFPPICSQISEINDKCVQVHGAPCVADCLLSYLWISFVCKSRIQEMVFETETILLFLMLLSKNLSLLNN